MTVGMTMGAEEPWSLSETLRAIASVFDLANVGVAALDATGGVVFHNDVAARIGGVQATASSVRRPSVRTSDELIERLSSVAAALYDAVGNGGTTTHRIRPRVAPIVFRLTDPSRDQAAVVVLLQEERTDASVAALLALL